MNAAQFFDHWNIVWRDLMRGVTMLEDQNLSYRPASSYKRSIGDILRHITNLEQGWIHYVVLRELDDWPEESASKASSIEALKTEMDQAHKKTMDALAKISVDEFNRIVQVPGDGTPKLGWILWHVFEQHVHHRGELFLCLSLLGKDRPLTNRPE